MRFVLLLSLFFQAVPGFGQQLVIGKITDEAGEPVPFVNIGIQDSHIGTISELNGDFELKVPEAYKDQTLLFSCVGYHRLSFSIPQLSEEPLQITLEENVAQLQEIVISEKRQRPKIEKIGGIYATASRFMTDVDYSGSAIVKRIETPFDTTFIHWISLGYSNKLRELKMRIKFLRVGEEGKPGEPLILKDIIVDLDPDDGYKKFNLEYEFLFLTEKAFIIQFEPLILKEDRRNIYKILSWAIKEHPDEVYFDERGELIVNSNKFDLPFPKFKVFGKIGNSTFYKTSSFGTWYPSEELSAKIGISDGASIEN